MTDDLPIPESSQAILTYKRRHHTRRHFIVNATCPGCGHCQTVGFAGWDAILCGGCGAELKRTPYRKAAWR